MIELPNDFLEEIRRLLGERSAMDLRSALASLPVVSLRLNSEKLSKQIGATNPELLGFYIEADRIKSVPWCESGYYLKSRPSFTMDPLFHAGCYYPQEASSMFLEQVVKRYIIGPVRALDLCAAPGGKSTHLCSLLPEGSILVSNEVVRARGLVLTENLIKWGVTNSVVTMNSAKDIGCSGQSFNFILVDAPCSGEGMFRKEKRSIGEWSLDNVMMCADRQRSILEDIWPALMPGGVLVYSTCTYNKIENEQNVIWACDKFKADLLPVPVLPEWGVSEGLDNTDTNPVYRFFPHKAEGEGFFMAVLRKPTDAYMGMDNKIVRRECKKISRHSALEVCRSWLENPNSYILGMKGERVLAFPARLADDMGRIDSELRCLRCGLEMGIIKGANVIPSHQLAMSLAYEKSTFNSVELSLEQALDYLHHEAVRIPSSPRGIVLLTYRGVPLGFAKNIGNRANNMYPQEWRIRKSVR